MYIPSASRERGASVLAALVVAAVLASIGIAVQETGPVAILRSTQTQSAAAATPVAPSENVQKIAAEIKNKPGYDFTVLERGEAVPYKVCPVETEGNESGKPYPEKANPADWGKNNGRCVHVPNVGIGPGKNWKSIVRFCDPGKNTSYLVKDLVQTKQGEPECKIFSYVNEKGDIVSDGKAGPSSSGAGASPSDSATPPVPSVPGDDKKQLAEAFSNLESKKTALEQESDELSNDYEQNLKTLEMLGCGSASESPQCTIARQEQKSIENRLQSITNEYDNLNKAQKALSAGELFSCEPGSEGCYNMQPSSGDKNKDIETALPGDRIPNGNPNTTFGPSGATSAACQQCQAGNQNACMQCAQTQGNGLGKMGQGAGGQKGGGGSGGGGQQQPQCQPKYFCNGNTLMYAPCANNQSSNAQSVQQCPSGYACQATNGSTNSSCQPSAPYGYCADGRTPRTAQAQQQPPASTCTVGAWQDTSNGCQTSWQCIAGASNTSQPTAQLSCQPKNAVAGMTINFSYACANGATSAVATGFSLPTGAPLAGTATTSAVKPAGTQTVVYSLTCSNASSTPALTASAQCSVQVGNPTIVVVATPEKVEKNETEEIKRKSTIGWVTTGMRACRVSSPSFEVWTNDQSSNTSIAGVAVTPVITADTTFFVACETLGGTTATSSVKILAI